MVEEMVLEEEEHEVDLDEDHPVPVQQVVDLV